MFNVLAIYCKRSRVKKIRSARVASPTTFASSMDFANFIPFRPKGDEQERGQRGGPANRRQKRAPLTIVVQGPLNTSFIFSLFSFDEPGALLVDTACVLVVAVFPYRRPMKSSRLQWKSVDAYDC